MLVELGLVEQRYQAVLEVLVEGKTVSEVAARFGVTRQRVHLIATDTREGDAHVRLLDNLIEAANELGGKMFESLGLVGEIALAEAGVDKLETLLQRTYQGDGSDPLSMRSGPSRRNAYGRSMMSSATPKTF